MSKLVIEELRQAISQEFFTTNRINIVALAPWLFKNKTPAGTFRMVVTQNGLISGSKDFTSAEIEAATASGPTNYWHGVYKVIFDVPFAINEGNFTISLEHTGYTFTELNYLGWVKPYVDKYNDESHGPVSDYYNTLGLTLWGYSSGENMTRVLDINDGFSSVSDPTVSSSVNQVGSQGAPVAVPLAGYTDPITTDLIIFIEGDGGAIGVTGNPQISTAEVGTRIYMRGTSDVNTVTFSDGNGLNLNGPCELGDGSILELIKTDVAWDEVSRNE